MTGSGLGQLLADAVHEAELRAPTTDPLRALAHARRRRERRRGHVAILAFVFFMAVLQALPSEAFGSSAVPVTVAAPGAALGAGPAREAEQAQSGSLPHPFGV